ncbi:MAG: hypothetical protein N2B06_07620 [Clostridium sp.]
MLAPELGLTFTTNCTDQYEVTSTVLQHGEVIAKSNCSSNGVMNEGIELIYEVIKSKVNEV